jgi:uncharacterized protein YfcZ (UPF0381/DUF406 family)
VKTHPQDSVLDLFRGNWDRLDDEWLFGTNVYGFPVFQERVKEHQIAPPETSRQLSALLHQHSYVEGEIRCSGNAIRALTDDDELQLAWYIMDQRRVTMHPGRVALMLRDQWELPEDVTSPEPIPDSSSNEAEVESKPFAPECKPILLIANENSEASVYAVFLQFEDSGSLSHQTNSFRIPGIRLAGLCDYLSELRLADVGEHQASWPFAMKLLRSQVDSSLEQSLRACCKYDVGTILNTLNCSKFFGDTQADSVSQLEKMIGNETAYRNESEHSMIQTSPYMAQLSLHTSTWERHRLPSLKLYHRWIFFDDIWARAHRDLAGSILMCGLYWDTPDKRN